MPPKKKGNKKGQDDWEADLGESIAPAGEQPPADGANGNAEGEDDDAAGGGGGLMAMLRKRKEKRKQKGLPDEEQAETVGEPVLAQQTAQEANVEDEFALPDKKGKGGKGKQTPNKEDPETASDGRVLTKAEKEKLKKEREKQRKKEQVGFSSLLVLGMARANFAAYRH
jgi:translation initiation factor 5B